MSQKSEKAIKSRWGKNQKNPLKQAFIVTSVLIMCPVLTPKVEARPFRAAQVPNGNRFGCLTCHFNPTGGAVNSFGYDVSLRLVGGNVNWSAVCDLDSDGDEYTNGEELGDPECSWVEGASDPSGTLTAPGDPNSFPRPPLPDQFMMDMSVVDMFEIDMEISPDQEVIDQEIPLWDAALYDFGAVDAFTTTAEPWISPDFTAPEEADLALDTDFLMISGGEEAGEAVAGADNSGEEISGDDQNVDMGRTMMEADESTSDESGVNQEAKSGCNQLSNHPFKTTPLLIVTFSLLGFFIRPRLIV